MVINTICPCEQIKRYGAWSVWPFYEDTPEHYRTGKFTSLHHKEYHKGGVVYRKIHGKWVKYRDGKSVYFTC